MRKNLFYILMIQYLLFAKCLTVSAANSIPSSLYWQKLNLETQVETKIKSLLKASAPELEVLVKVLITANPKDKKTTDTKREKFLKALNGTSGNVEKGSNTDIILRKLDVTTQDFFQEDMETEVNQMTFPDLLEDINNIDVFLYFNKDITKDARSEIVKLISEVFKNKFNRNLNIVTADIPYEYQAPMKEIEKSFEEKFAQYFIPLSILSGLITIGAVFLFLVLQLKKMVSDVLSLIREISPSGDDKTNKSEIVSEESLSSTKNSGNESFQDEGLFQEISFQKLLGVKRFKNLMDSDINEARYIFRKWTISKVDVENKIVCLLARSMEDDEILKLTKSYPAEINSKIKDIISFPIGTKELPNLDRLIDEAIMGSLLDSRPHLPLVTREVIDLFGAERIAEVCNISPLVGSILLHYCERNNVMRAMSLIKLENLEKCLNYTKNLDTDFLQQNMSEIQSFVAKAAEELFFEKSSSVLNIFPMALESASLANEQEILRIISSQIGRHEFSEIVLNRLPCSYLIDRFEVVAKIVFASCSSFEKAELIHNLPERVAWPLKDWIGVEGSKAREVLEVELNNLNSISDSLTDRPWTIFFQKMRTVLKSNYEFTAIARKEVDDWVEEKFQLQNSKGDIKISLAS